MTKGFSKYIIVGAGLSGLTTAYTLMEAGDKNFKILESRNRVGGRILTKEGIDLGATWFQNHHTHVSSILEKLGVGKFHQYSDGQSILVYSSMAPAHYFENDPNAPSAYRIEGNSEAMIHALAEPLWDTVHLETVVLGVTKNKDRLTVTTDNGIFTCEKLVITIPPRIVKRISFQPQLASHMTKAMEKTHTWMSNAMKVGITFKSAFWKEKNMSGMIIGQGGAVTELYDHSTMDTNKHALMGFINEGLRDLSKEARKERILSYLEKYMGSQIREYLTYAEKDWSQDKDTSSDTIKSVYLSPTYGNPIFSELYMDNSLFFSGAETSPVYGGYMDGAIFSGIRAAQKITSKA